MLNIISKIPRVSEPLLYLLPIIIKKVKEIFSNRSKRLSEEDITTNHGIINIGEEIENFNKNLESQFSETEEILIKKIEEQLEEYIEIAKKLEEYPEVRRNTLKKIKSDINRYKSTLKGFLLILLRKNISIDNDYLIKILKMEKSPTKERMIEDFMIQSTKKTLEEYSNKILKDLKEISRDILEEFDELVEDLEIQKKEEVQELTKLEESSSNFLIKEEMICNKILEIVFLKNI